MHNLERRSRVDYILQYASLTTLAHYLHLPMPRQCRNPRMAKHTTYVDPVLSIDVVLMQIMMFLLRSWLLGERVLFSLRVIQNSLMEVQELML